MRRRRITVLLAAFVACDTALVVGLCGGMSTALLAVIACLHASLLVTMIALLARGWKDTGKDDNGDLTATRENVAADTRNAPPMENQAPLEAPSTEARLMDATDFDEAESCEQHDSADDSGDALGQDSFETKTEAQSPAQSPSDVKEKDPAPQVQEDEAAIALEHAAKDATNTFSFPDFCAELLGSERQMAFLCDLCERVAKDDAASPFERYLTRRLDEADIASWEENDTPWVRIIIPSHSGMFYLQTLPRIEFGWHLKALRVESALNAARFAYDYLDDPAAASEEELMRVEQRFISSVCAQVSDINSSDWSYLAMPWQTGWGPSERGEWAVRCSLSESIETLKVPHRLVANFRSNVAEGDVAIEIDATPARVFARTAFVDGLGIVPTTSHMRGREASKYAARMGILLANCAFRASERVRRVWVALVRSNPSSRSCLWWACFDRRVFSHLRMDAIGDPLDAISRLGATLSLENEVLQPVDQGFYLEDERFCPSRRHDLWQMSERSLPPSAALHLGTSRVSGLVIHEELLRTIVADDALRGIPQSQTHNATQVGVRSILEAAHKTSDMNVWGAAERVAAKLVDGSLALDDEEALREELIAGDPLSRAVKNAQQSLANERPDVALEQLRAALAPIDGTGAYADSPSTVYRSFDSFAERALYNRLNANDRRCIILVPDAYVIAHLLVSSILLSRSLSEEAAKEDDADRALAHARRAHEVAPLATSAFLGTIACLERTGNLADAESALRDMLEVAHDPQGIGLAYYRMAAIQWQLGHHAACIACYQLAAGLMPSLIPIIMAERHMLSRDDHSISSALEPSEVELALSEQKIPLAPTPRISFLIYDCATASIDAEVFPLAHDLMRILESFTGDDVIHGIRNSLEHEPDV